MAVAYGAGLAAYLLSLLTPVENIEMRTLDWRFTFRGPVGEKPAGLVLVNVDEQAELPYRKPLPRRHLAQVVRVLDEAGARLIGLDVFLGERSFDAAGDSLLRAALSAADSVVLASQLDRGAEGLAEVELNPVIVTPDRAVAVDALIRRKAAHAEGHDG